LPPAELPPTGGEPAEPEIAPPVARPPLAGEPPLPLVACAFAPAALVVPPFIAFESDGDDEHAPTNALAPKNRDQSIGRDL